MAFETLICEDSYVADGTTNPRDIGFPIDNPGALFVDVDGVSQTLGSDYLIDGDYAAGLGRIIPVEGWADGAVVDYYRITSLVQSAAIPAGLPLPSRRLEAQLDRDVMRIQELGQAVDRAPLIPRRGGVNGRFPVVGPDGTWIWASGTGNDPDLRVDLASEGGGEMVRYDPPWDGAIGRKIQSKLDDGVCDLSDFDVKTSRSNNSSYIQAALDAIDDSKATGACVTLKDGRYLIQDRISCTGKTIALVGQAESVSVIVADGPQAGFDFLVGAETGEDDTRRLVIRDFTIEKIYEHTGPELPSSAIMFDGAYTGINAHIDRFRSTNVSIRARTELAVWQDGIVLSDVGGGYIESTKFGNVGPNGDLSSLATGGALRIKRVHSSNCDRFHINNSYFHRFQSGILFDQSAAVAGGSIEGIYIATSEIVGCNRGIWSPAGAHAAVDYLNGLHFVGGHMDVHDYALDAHFLVNGHLLGNFIIKSENGGTAQSTPIISLDGYRVDILEIIGNAFVRPLDLPVLADGIRLPGGLNVVKVRVIGNSFESLEQAVYCSTAPSDVHPGIVLAEGNQFINVTTPYGAGIFAPKKVLSGFATVASGDVVQFGQRFVNQPQVVPVHVGTATAVNVTVSDVTNSQCKIHHNGVGSLDVAWIASGH